MRKMLLHGALLRRTLLPALAMCLVLVNVAMADVKIGVVDMQVIAAESAPAKDAREKMQEKYGKEREQLEKQAATLRKKADALKKSPASKEKREEFIRLSRDYDEKTRNFARKVEQDEVRIRQDMVTLVFRAAYEVSQRKGFNYVVDATAGGVLYADQSMDITRDVLEEVDTLWKSGALKSQGGPSGPGDEPGKADKPEADKPKDGKAKADKPKDDKAKADKPKDDGAGDDKGKK